MDKKDVVVGVDRIKIGVAVATPEDELYGAMKDWELGVRREDFGKAGKVWKKHELSSLTMVSQPLSNGSIQIRYGYLWGCYRIWYQFNHNKSPLDEIGAHFSLLFDGGFRELYRRGVATESEIFVDVDGVNQKDFLYIDTALTTSDSTFGAKGTQYIGSRSSNRRITAYDKRRQLASKEQFELGHERLRIEARLKGVSRFQFREIGFLKNPFASLLVIESSRLQEIGGDAVKNFTDRAAALGSGHAAYRILPQKIRAELLNVFEKAKPAWWNPSELWTKFPSSLGWIEALRYHFT